MNEKNIALAGILLGLNTVNIPNNLRKFLTSDGMDGMKDLEFMLKDSKLSRRIPQNVRYEYETVYASLSIELDERLNDLEKAIKEMRSNPREIIHDAIQKSLEQ